MDRIYEALEFAALAHEGQFRKNPSKRLPYFIHCAAVGMTLQQAGYDEDTVVAGILHDTLEDTATDFDDLARTFGERVAHLVQSVTYDEPDAPWHDRKKQYIGHIAHAEPESVAISAADKTHNLRSLLGEAPAIFDHMNAPKKDQQWYYRSVFEAIEARLTAKHQLVKGLRPLVERLEKM
ncbi:MAG: HD domain-containing protein [Planctomycetota bacterium]